MRHPHLVCTGLAAALILAGCSTGATDGADAPVVVSTTAVLGSVVDEIAQCTDTASATLMGPGDDPHEFSPSSQQITQLARAELVVANGLGMEANLEKAIDNARAEGAVVFEVAPEVDPIPFGATHGDHEHDGDEHADHDHSDEHADHDHSDDDGGGHSDHGHDHGDLDPHFALDVGRMADAAQLIGAELAEVTGDEQFTTCGEQVSAELTELDAQVRDTLSVIPDERRVIITDHDAFGYFAQAYDFEIAGVVVPGGSTDAEASSRHLAELVQVIEERNITTIFSNSATNPQLVEALAQETGRDIEVVALYVDSVGPEGSGAETYAGMMTTNATLLADALK